MAEHDNILVTGPYIAYQSVGTQFIGGRHTHQYYTPEQPQHADERSVEDVAYLPIPAERNYTQVRKYIQERCRFDEEFRQYVESHSRVELCQRLSKEFGWFVDDHHLGVNMNRHRK